MGSTVPVKPLTRLDTLTSVDVVNENFRRLSDALDNVLSGRGSKLTNSIDADGRAILNLPDAVTDNQPVTKRQLEAAGLAVSIVGVSIDDNGHLIVTLSNGTTIDAGLLPTGGGAVPAPIFTSQPSLSPAYVTSGSPITITPGVAANASSVTRTAFLNGTTALTISNNTVTPTAAGTVTYQETAIGLNGTSVSSQIRTATVADAAPSFSTVYAQGMGATAADGMVASIPLPTNAKRMYLDTRSGSGASDSYNGLSPYPGFKMNGTGPDGQYGATGQGVANSAYGPKLGFISAETALGAPGIGHQVCLAQGGTYVDPPATTASNRATGRYGESALKPFVIQSYDPADPTNEQKMGRAKGSNYPKIQLSTDRQWNFKTDVNNGGGVISNFAFRGLRFVDSSGSRTGSQTIINFGQIDGSNYLFENLDCGSASLQINNNSDGAGGTRDARWSRNLIVRKCLVDRNVAPNSLFPSFHTSGWVGVVGEDLVFTHCSWSDTAEDRYVENTADTAQPTFFRHDNYHAGGSQWPNMIRRCVSINPAATFLSNRNNVEAYQNVIINAPIAGGAGGGVANITLEQPNGNYVDVHRNFSAGSQPIRAPKVIFSANPTGGYVTAGGLVLGLTTGTPSTGQVQIGSTVNQTIDNVVAALNASTRPYTSRVTYRRYNNEIRQTMKEPGTPYVVMSAGGDAGLSSPDPQPRSFPFGLTGPVAGSEVHHNLSVNSGYLDGSENMFVAPYHGGGPGADGVVSYGSFHDNKLRAWTPFLTPANVDSDFYHSTYVNEDYTLTSPYTNKQVWQALGFADEAAMEAAIIADHTQPWALRILAKAKELFGHEFELATVAPPTLTVPAPSTLAPKVGDTVTFPNPIISGTGGTIVSAATYVDNIPAANTGKTVNTLTVTNDMLGKRLSRMVVVKGNNGAPSATAFYEIETKVAAASGGGGTGKRYFRLRAVGATDGAAYADSGSVASLSETRFMNGASRIATTGWTTSGPQISSGEGHANLIDNDTGTFWTGAFGQTSVIVYDTGVGSAIKPTTIEMVDRLESPGRAPGEFFWDWSDDGTTWTQIYYQKVGGNYSNRTTIITPVYP